MGAEKRFELKMCYLGPRTFVTDLPGPHTPSRGRRDKAGTPFRLPLITDYTGQRPGLPSLGSRGVPPVYSIQGVKLESISDATQLGNNTDPEMSCFTAISFSEKMIIVIIRGWLGGTPRRKGRV
jgi:hypothetical protein